MVMEAHYKDGKGRVGIYGWFFGCRIVLIQTYGKLGYKNRINSKFTSLYAHTVG